MTHNKIIDGCLNFTVVENCSYAENTGIFTYTIKYGEEDQVRFGFIKKDMPLLDHCRLISQMVESIKREILDKSKENDT